MDEYELYASGKSISQVSEITGISMSTVRRRMLKAGILRDRGDGARLAAKEGRFGSGNRGKKRIFTDEWKSNISKSKKGVGVGLSIKNNGYLEITMGEFKGRLQHVVIIEQKIGRKLYSDECVHHIDHNKSNNDISNLVLMKRSEHSRLHARENSDSRTRDLLGRYN